MSSLFSKEAAEDDEDEENGIYVFCTSSDISSHVVTFSHVLYLDIIRRQIEYESRSEFPYVWLQCCITHGNPYYTVKPEMLASIIVSIFNFLQK